MWPIILVAGGLAGAYLYLSSRERAERSGNALDILNFTPFPLRPGNETVEVIARTGLTPEMVGQLTARQWQLNPRALPTLVARGIAIPGVVTGVMVDQQADIWRVPAAYSGAPMIFTPQEALNKFPGAAGTPIEPSRGLATLLFLSSISPSVADAITIPFNKVIGALGV